MTRRRRRGIEKRRRHAETDARASEGRRLAVGAGLTIGATLALAGTAHATDFTVNTAGDTGGNCDATPTTCTLRQAINSANSHAGSDQVLFHSGLSGSTIIFGEEPPQVTGPTDIVGIGADQLAIDGNGAHKIFDIDMTTPGDAVSISELTIQNGCCAGGIRNADANLTVTDAVITDNSAIGRGAGISSSGPSLTVERSTVSGNTQTGGNAGGGIFADYKLTLRDSTVSGNTAGADGGGIYVSYSGQPPYDGHGPHLIENSTISGNTAGSDGGGVSFCGSYYDTDRLSIESSTITGNNAAATALAGGGYGGGVASRCGAGYYGAMLQNTIVAGNSAANGDADINADAPVEASFSLIGEPSDGIDEGVTGSNLTGVDPLVAPLRDNGGPTETRAIAVSSPAVDQGATALTADQRGELRPFDVLTIDNPTGGDGSDMGAWEGNENDQPVPVLTVSTAGTGAGAVSGVGIDCAGAGTDCAGAFNSGQSALLSATPGSGSSFSGWTGCDSPSGNQCTMTMNANKSVTASFTLIPASGGGPTPPVTSGPTGLRARALKKCKKKAKGKKRKKCIKRAKRLPV
jgi:CSLREA domain-containing protein